MRFEERAGAPYCRVSRRGAFPRGAFPRGAFPRGAFPRGAFPRGAFPRGAFPRGAFPRGAFPRGASPRGAFPRGAFVVRHGSGGLMLLPGPPRMPAQSVTGPRRWRGKLGFAAATAVLLAAAVLLVTGAHVPAADHEGACPVRSSTAAYAGGRELLLRAEPVRQGVALLHLCADRPVRAWAVDLDGAGPVAVQGVAAGDAIAAVTVGAGRRTPVSVRIVPASGDPLVFVSQLITR